MSLLCCCCQFKQVSVEDLEKNVTLNSWPNKALSIVSLAS